MSLNGWTKRNGDAMSVRNHGFLFLFATYVLSITASTPSCAIQYQEERPPQNSALDDHRPMILEGGMAGWKVVGGTAEYEWKESCIHGFKPGVQNTFLMSEREYGDFIIEGEVKIDSGNSGWQIRSHLIDSKTNGGRLFGYQIEIDPSQRRWSGGLYDEGRRGWIHPLSNDPEAMNSFVVDGWNFYRIEAIGPHIRSWVNGVPCADVLDLADLSGAIALQVHSGDCEVWWRNLLITDLGRSRYVRTGEWVVQHVKEHRTAGDPDHGMEPVDDIVEELQTGDHAKFNRPIKNQGVSLRFKYQLEGNSTLVLRTPLEDKTIVEIPLHANDQRKTVLNREASLPIVAPGGGMADLGDEWMELIIDLESKRLVLIDEGRTLVRMNEVELGGSKSVQVAISCMSGTVKLKTPEVLVNEKEGVEHD